MMIDINPYRCLNANISPTDFEVFCMDTLKAYAEKENLSEFQLTHNQKVKTDDGTFQIDVLGEYVALGSNVKLIVECKMQTRSVDRDIVVALHGKLQSLGANKGILIATSGFQSGATHYAQKHGIALWQICDNEIRHFAMSANKQLSEIMMIQFEAEKYLPRHFAIEWDCSADFPYDDIYPTVQMRQNAIDKARAKYND
jgi:hypothetical protein